MNTFKSLTLSIMTVLFSGLCLANPSPSETQKLENGEYLASTFDFESNRIENVIVQLKTENGIQKFVSSKAPIEFIVTYGLEGKIYLHGVHADARAGIRMFTIILTGSPKRKLNGKIHSMVNGVLRKEGVFQLVPKGSL